MSITFDDLKDYEGCAGALRRKDASPESPSPVLSAMEVYGLALARVAELEAALRDMREHHCSCDFKEMDEDCWTCNRAREALGEVEK